MDGVQGCYSHDCRTHQKARAGPGYIQCQNLRPLHYISENDLISFTVSISAAELLLCQAAKNTFLIMKTMHSSTLSFCLICILPGTYFIGFSFRRHENTTINSWHLYSPIGDSYSPREDMRIVSTIQHATVLHPGQRACPDRSNTSPTLPITCLMRTWQQLFIGGCDVRQTVNCGEITLSGRRVGGDLLSFH